jgi:hypothetical protein
MTSKQFEIIDELYFVISYADLSSSLNLTDQELCEELTGIFSAGWLRVFKGPSETKDYELISDEILMNSFLLASKAGLKVHNSQ